MHFKYNTMADKSIIFLALVFKIVFFWLLKSLKYYDLGYFIPKLALSNYFQHMSSSFHFSKKPVR